MRRFVADDEREAAALVVCSPEKFATVLVGKPGDGGYGRSGAIE